MIAAPGAVVRMGGITFNGNPGSSHLTVSGLVFTGSAEVVGHGSYITFEDNTTSNVNNISAYYVLANAGVTISHVSVVGNTMDHLGCVESCSSPSGQCVTFVGPVEHITIDYNVCGPGIADHYTQTGGVSYLEEDHNTFLGPSARYAWPGVHQNILQIFGSSDHVSFSDNVIRDTGTNSNSLLIESTPPEHATFSDVSIENNLWDHETDGETIGICPVNGLSFKYNTIVGSVWGSHFSPTSSTTANCGPGANYDISHNIFAETTKAPDFEYGGTGKGLACETNCTVDYNVTTDETAQTEDTDANSLANWTPSWTNTTEYQPLGLPFTAGYQGGGGSGRLPRGFTRR